MTVGPAATGSGAGPFPRTAPGGSIDASMLDPSDLLDLVIVFVRRQRTALGLAGFVAGALAIVAFWIGGVLVYAGVAALLLALVLWIVNAWLARESRR